MKKHLIRCLCGYFMTHLVLLLFLRWSPLILLGDLSLLSDRVGEGERLEAIICLVGCKGTALDPDRGAGWIGWEPEALTGVGNIEMSWYMGIGLSKLNLGLWNGWLLPISTNKGNESEYRISYMRSSLRSTSCSPAWQVWQPAYCMFSLMYSNVSLLIGNIRSLSAR